jgi:outer membrane protein
MKTPILLAAALLAAGTAQAQTEAKALNWTFKAGALRYDTHAKSSGINGIGVPPGADVEVGDANTLVLTLERHLDANWGLEFAFGLPPRVKAKGAGSVAFLNGEILSAKNYGPTLLLNYHFGQPGAALRPYVGAGINYTQFRGERSTLAPEVYLNDSFGLAAHVGLDWTHHSKRWGAYVSIARVDVKTDVTAIGATVLTSSLDFRPWTYSAGMLFKF